MLSGIQIEEAPGKIFLDVGELEEQEDWLLSPNPVSRVVGKGRALEGQALLAMIPYGFRQCLGARVRMGSESEAKPAPGSPHAACPYSESPHHTSPGFGALTLFSSTPPVPGFQSRETA